MVLNMAFKRIEFLGFPLDVGVDAEHICELLGKKGGPYLISFVNPAAWALAKRRPEYLEYLRQMSLNLADGEGVACTCRWLLNENCQRLSFDMSSLAPPFFKKAVEKGASIMLIGGKPGVDEEVQGKLQTYMPNIRIIGSQHGYGDIMPKVSAVIKAAPNAVIVGMGSPRQEAFLLALRDAGYKGLAITCGGFFDQYLSADPYYPGWIDQYNLRWAYRLYKEPGRLWRRYLIDYPRFLWRAFVAFAHKSNDAFKRS